MAIPILMPALSPTMKEGNITKWLKKEGDKISPGEVIAEIETDKAAMEVEAVDAGFLGKICIAAGASNIPVNTLIAIIKEKNDPENAVEEYLKHHKKSTDSVEVVKTKSSATNKPNSAEISRPQSSSNERLFITPLAKKIAKEHSIMVTDIEGTGPRGRIIKNDVLLKLENQTSSTTENANIIPLDNMRKTIATRLTQSKQQIPHFYLKAECNADNLLRMREEMNKEANNGIKISVNDFLVKIVAKALEKHKEINSSWNDDHIIQYNTVDISVAVSIEGGLVTPIVKNANKKDLSEISVEIKNLANKAKSNSLRPEEFIGGTFTISNLGPFEIEEFSAIINPPQAAILAIGSCVKKPVFEASSETMKIANCITLCLSCDHRVIDGVKGAQFLNTIKKIVENPVLILL